MEKRFTVFMVLSSLVIVAHMMLQSYLNPPEPMDEPLADPATAVGDQDPSTPEEAGEDSTSDVIENEPAESSSEENEAEAIGADPESQDTEMVDAAVADDQPDIPLQRVSLGSMKAGSPYRLLVTLNNRGASVERIELTERSQNKKGNFRYHELEKKSGYLGHLAVRADLDSGLCRVGVVGDGTPADLATSADSSVTGGLKANDLLKTIDGQAVASSFDLKAYLETTRPGQQVTLEIQRTSDDGQTADLTFTTTLTEHPLNIIQPETNPDSDSSQQDPLSFLLTLERLGGKSLPLDQDELRGLPSLKHSNWQVKMLPDEGQGQAAEFRTVLNASDLQEFGLEGALEIVKRYRLAATAQDQLDNPNFKSYHLTLEVEIRNQGTSSQELAYRLDGANGLPLEGWWYSNKTHPSRFSAAGARDVIWKMPGMRHNLIGCPTIYANAKKAEEKEEPFGLPLFPEGEPQTLAYAGVDTQYFSVVLVPLRDQATQPGFSRAAAITAGDPGEKKKTRRKTTNVTFRLDSQPTTIAAGETLRQDFVVFAGPKQPDLLAQYDLEECISYGWFKRIAIPLSWILHVFASLPLVTYGLAIILLTVLVRSAMMPISRKAAKNAQMMQELSPEMKRIAEKYKDDMEKRAAAQRELFAKHNYNPFGGCLLMFIQLPIFIGLYRSLSVDIELRQAALIPGLPWCSNLAGPDMLLYWKPFLWSALADETGWLGPYLNVLPIFTIILFLVQQKLFMPPATDEQTRMQQSMMKYMMIFMGVMFFRVPSGLCIYFIASSIWGIAERKLLPPPAKPGSGNADPKKPTDAKAAAAIEAKKARRRGPKKK